MLPKIFKENHFEISIDRLVIDSQRFVISYAMVFLSLELPNWAVVVHRRVRQWNSMNQFVGQAEKFD